VPLFFFQAVQASLLPRLSALVGAGQFDELVNVFRRLLGLVAGIGGVAIVVCALFGTWIVEFAFGADFAVERQDMVLLAASSAVMMMALSFAQALVACRAQGRMALAWVFGLVAFPPVVALGDDLFLRVELGLLATVSVAAASMAILFSARLRSTDRWNSTE
jgi:O-antigen/teichoic acid export membrane protein